MKTAEHSPGSGRIVLTGASGFIGSSVRSSFRSNSTKILQLVRGGSEVNQDRLAWDPYAAAPIDHSSLGRLEGAAAVIHLSGANVSSHRWTPGYKQTILESRIRPTHAVAKLLAGLRTKPSALLCASAVGIYGNRGDQVLDETSSPGSGFLAEVCRAWEEAARPAADAGIRVVHMRFGVVLSPAGGALARMLPLFRLGLGSRLGSGLQWMSWVALPDLVRAIEFLLSAPEVSGAVNVVAPLPVTNSEFTHALGQALERPAFLRVPALGLRIGLGEMAQGALLASQRAVPRGLEAAGFHFQHGEIRSTLNSLLPV